MESAQFEQLQAQLARVQALLEESNALRKDALDIQKRTAEAFHENVALNQRALQEYSAQRWWAWALVAALTLWLLWLR